MWRNKKEILGLIDTKIVKRDFIIAEGSTLSHSFLHKEETPFKRNIWVPVFYLFKVHKNHPMKISSASSSHVHIYPANEFKKKKPRMLMEVYKDKMDYDCATFITVPFNIDETNIGRWKKFKVEKSFSPEKNGSLQEDIRNLKQDVSLLYLNHGVEAGGQDALPRVSEVMPSQVMSHFYSWLYSNPKIVSHEKTFNQKLEGRIDIPVKSLRSLTRKVTGVLEERYNTRLSFKD